MSDLYNDILQIIEQTKISVYKLVDNGRKYGLAVQDYRVDLREEILLLESQGRPVTNLYYIARGSQKVALSKFKEIEAEAIYKANQERINLLKLEMRIKEKQLEREWAQND